MPIINPPTQQPTVKDTMTNLNTNGYNAVKNVFEQNFNLLNNAVNPQVVLDEWGTDAASLFEASQATVQYLQFINPDYIPPTTDNTYTHNPDGTITWNVPIIEE